MVVRFYKYLLCHSWSCRKLYVEILANTLAGGGKDMQVNIFAPCLGIRIGIKIRDTWKAEVKIDS